MATFEITVPGKGRFEVGGVETEQQALAALTSQLEGAQVAPQPKPPVDFSLRTMLGNVPASAGRAVGDMIQPIMHPVDTASAFGNVIAGAVQKLWPGEQSKEPY